MHFPIEFLLLGLVGEGSRWIGNKGWLPPKESGMPFKSRGKVGYLGADGKPAEDETGKKLSAKEKAAIMKREEEMKAKEMGIEVKPEKKPRAKKQKAEETPAESGKASATVQSADSLMSNMNSSRVGGVSRLGNSAKDGFKTGDAIIPVQKGQSKDNEFMGSQRSGHIKGDWLVERDGTVSHIPSGFKVGAFANYNIGRQAVNDLIKLNPPMPEKAGIGLGRLTNDNMLAMKETLTPYRKLAANEGVFY